MMAQIKMVYVATSPIFAGLAYVVGFGNRAFHNVINHAVSAVFDTVPTENPIAMIGSTALVIYATMRLQLQKTLNRTPSTAIIMIVICWFKSSFASLTKLRFKAQFFTRHSLSLSIPSDMNKYHTSATGQRGIAS